MISFDEMSLMMDVFYFILSKKVNRGLKNFAISSFFFVILTNFLLFKSHK
jgi:hypothetical protein